MISMDLTRLKLGNREKHDYADNILMSILENEWLELKAKK